MSTYIHKVNYYETDKMGITHHSNYIRFIEEARMSFLAEIGYPMTRLEAEGITSPVVSVNCEYRHPTTYSDEIEIEVTLTKYNGVKLSLSYVMKNVHTGVTVAIASSSHCFIDANGRPIAVKKHFPSFDEALKSQVLK
ncbi:MAG: acyl-CoA thioesterase [Clostridia bacterium]|nr:acyl-CoA thioesterase [Clostridia bacterium]